MPKKILVVDDESIIRGEMRKLLEGKGYKIVEAQDGDEALAAYDQENPEVVLLDMRMPGKDGLEVLKAIRQHDSGAAVIMTTAVHDTDTVVRAMELGACDYLVKPINRDQVVVSVERAIGSTSLPVVVRLKGMTTEATRALGGPEIDVPTFPFKIGRKVDSTHSDMLDDNNLYIDEDKPYMISRNHCAIVYSGEAVSVLDRGSTRGTIVDEEHLRGQTNRVSARLSPGVHSLILGPKSSPYHFSLIIE